MIDDANLSAEAPEVLKQLVARARALVRAEDVIT